MQAHIRFPQTDGTFLYFPYDGSALTVAQANALFNAKTYEQKVATTTNVLPALNAGFIRYKVRESVIVEPELSAVYGSPRTLMGTRNGFSIFALNGKNHLWEQYASSPDDGAPKGGNLPNIQFAAGAVLPTGLVDTAYGGQAPPDDFVTPDGYQLKFFNGQVDQKHYKLSDEPDETPNVPEEPEPPTGSVGNTAIVVANGENMPIAIENNGTKWRVRKTGGESITLLYINGERKNDLGGYDYLPGEQVSIIALFGAANPDNTNTFTFKAYYLITFGDI